MESQYSQRLRSGSGRGKTSAPAIPALGTVTNVTSGTQNKNTTKNPDLPSTSIFTSNAANAILNEMENNNQDVIGPNNSANSSDNSSTNLDHTQINFSEAIVHPIPTIPTSTSTISSFSNTPTHSNFETFRNPHINNFRPSQNNNAMYQSAHINEFINASIGASHAAILLDVEKSLRRLIPEIVTQSMQAERERQLNNISTPTLDSYIERRRSRVANEIFNENPIENQSIPIAQNHNNSSQSNSNNIPPAQPIIPSVSLNSNTITTSILNPVLVSASTVPINNPNSIPNHLNSNLQNRPTFAFPYPPPNYNPQHSIHQPNYFPNPNQNYSQIPNNRPPTLQNQNSLHQEDIQSPRCFVRFDKWGLQFDGNTQNFTIDDFLFRVESLRRDYNCPWTELLKNFHHLLSGRASEWFWNFRRQHPFSDFEDLKNSMIRKFRIHDSDVEIQCKIADRKQKASEPVENFIDSLMQLRNQMRNRIAEYELVRIAKQNLKEGLYQLLFPMSISNMDQLLEEGKRAERNLAKRSSESHRYQQNYRRINELEITPQDPQQSFFEVDAIRYNQNSPNIICHNCKKPGHSYYQCSVVPKRIFCFRCGTDNVTTPNCPKCSGNISASMRTTGTSCSTQTQTQ